MKLPASFLVSRLKALFVPGVAALLAGCAGVGPIDRPVEVRILAINDFHGNLEPPAGGVRIPDPDRPGASITIPSGGAARLASAIAERSAGSPNTVMVAAGDLIGASPLLSSMFQDEPTIESLSQMGLALSAVGNHEFDEGLEELRRMQNGGCHPRVGCRGPAVFKGAGFRYLAASTIDDATGRTVFPSHEIREFGGVKVAFIGLTLRGTPALLAPPSRAGLTFLDEAESVNREVSKLKTQGVEAFIVLIHEGGFNSAGDDKCEGLSGPITEIIPKLDKAVDVIISGHTHRSYVCRIDGRLLTSASQYGTMFTEMSLTLDRGSRDIVRSEAQNVIVRAELFEEDPLQTDLIGAYKRLAAPLMERSVGRLTAPLGYARDPAGESDLGSVIADAMREAAVIATGQPFDVAFMNPGGIRGDLSKSGDVTFADLFAVQPFGNSLTALTLTGSEIEAVLRQQFRTDGMKILHVSDGFSYRWRRQADGSGVLVSGSVRVNGAPLNPERAYRVVTNNFVASGGDGFTAFSVGRDVTPVGGDVEALETYLGAHSPVSAPARGRVVLESGFDAR
jgi:5'-nucleotidase